MSALALILGVAILIAGLVYLVSKNPLQCLIFAIICPSMFYLSDKFGFYEIPQFDLNMQDESICELEESQPHQEDSNQSVLLRI